MSRLPNKRLGSEDYGNWRNAGDSFPLRRSGVADKCDSLALPGKVFHGQAIAYRFRCA